MADIKGFHAHVYYDAGNKAEAARLREAIDARFDARLGRWHDEPVGPHPQGMYQVAFDPEVFAELVPYLMLHHGSLDVLVHPETGDHLADHRDHALWIGAKLPLRLEVFRTRAGTT